MTTHYSQSSPLSVIIPSFGKDHLTKSLVSQCWLERDLVDVIVVDNSGTYSGSGWEEVILPGINLGWLKGVNRGLEAAQSLHNYLAYIPLNNDTVLSVGFFRGILDAIEACDEAAIVAPCYDDVYPSQNQYFTGAPSEFVPREVERFASAVDGTCFAIRGDDLSRIGGLDDVHFGRRGWGAIEDLCIRVKRAERKTVVTQRSYLSHQRGSTARSTYSAYEKYAYHESQRGLRRKWGRGWASLLDQPSLEATGILDVPRQWWWHVVDPNFGFGGYFRRNKQAQ